MLDKATHKRNKVRFGDDGKQTSTSLSRDWTSPYSFPLANVRFGIARDLPRVFAPSLSISSPFFPPNLFPFLFPFLLYVRAPGVCRTLQEGKRREQKKVYQKLGGGKCTQTDAFPCCHGNGTVDVTGRTERPHWRGRAARREQRDTGRNGSGDLVCSGLKPELQSFRTPIVFLFSLCACVVRSVFCSCECVPG